MSVTLRSLAMLIALGTAITAQAGGPPYSPYQQAESNTLYNQLFCDDLASYRSGKNATLNRSWRSLFRHPLDVNAVRKLAYSRAAESRQRLLAFRMLAQHKQKTGQKILLGIVVEVAFEQGLDTLAAYDDLSVQYLHRNGKVQVIQKPDAEMTAIVRKLFQEAQPIIEKIKPWSRGRLPPPSAGTVRLTFLVSDGLYFGQGTMSHLARSPLAGPVLTAATELLFKVTRH